MRQLEVFMDYACPYCLQGFEYLRELVGSAGELEVVWRLCEAHPRPESYGKHSDLCIQAWFYAQENGVDAWTFHERMFRAALKGRVDIENAADLSRYVADLVDAGELCAALLGNAYAVQLRDANRYAFVQCGVWVVPAFKAGGARLDAIEDVGVTKAQLRSFLQA